MLLSRKTQDKPSQEFRRISIRQIRKNPNQPRRLFEPEALAGLAESIRRYGVITPLTVRQVDDGFELVAGERRLRAAAIAGLSAVPCYIVSVNDEQSSLMALLENLQREDLDFFEEAASLRRLCDEYHMTQQEAAQRIGKTQSAVANKLRLLRLSPETVAAVRQYHLTERHARTLLQLPEEPRRLEAARYMGQHAMTVAQAEHYVERLLGQKEKNRPRVLIKDVRIFCNTVERAVRLMRSGGLQAQLQQRQEGEELVLTVRVPAALVKAQPLTKNA